MKEKRDGAGEEEREEKNKGPQIFLRSVATLPWNLLSPCESGQVGMSP